MAGRGPPKTSGPRVPVSEGPGPGCSPPWASPHLGRSRRLRQGWCSLGGVRAVVPTRLCEEPAGHTGRRAARGPASWSAQLGRLPTSAGTCPQPPPTPQRPRLHPKHPARFPEYAGPFRGAAASPAETPDLQGPSRGPRGAKPGRGVDAARGVRGRGPARDCLRPGVRDADARTKLPAKLT